VSAWSFAKQTIFNPHSPACLWKRPRQGGRLVFAALSNGSLRLLEQLGAPARQDCPICHWRGRRFRAYLSPETVIPASICPDCGSFDRHRHLALGIRAELEARGRVPREILGFSISQDTRSILEREGLGRCFRSDFDNTDARYDPDVVADLREAAYRTASVDWIVCSHVLEHIAELSPAVDEMLRILRPGGVAWIQVAVDDAVEHSHPIPIDPFSYDAHAWRFGGDVTALLERDGWSVTCHRASEQLDADTRARCGIHPVERYWLARKPA
jgi:SAM-dependent methyltransferase